jgi:hypothetical protein
VQRPQPGRRGRIECWVEVAFGAVAGRLIGGSLGAGLAGLADGGAALCGVRALHALAAVCAVGVVGAGWAGLAEGAVSVRRLPRLAVHFNTTSRNL